MEKAFRMVNLWMNRKGMFIFGKNSAVAQKGQFWQLTLKNGSKLLNTLLHARRTTIHSVFSTSSVLPLYYNKVVLNREGRELTEWVKIKRIT